MVGGYAFKFFVQQQFIASVWVSNLFKTSVPIPFLVRKIFGSKSLSKRRLLQEDATANILNKHALFHLLFVDYIKS